MTETTIRLHFMDQVDSPCQGLYLAGREIARATSCDSGATLGPGVVLVQGDMPTSGGTRQEWRTIVPAGCVVEVRDVPRAEADHLMDSPPLYLTVSVVGEPSADLEALKVRRGQLLAELGEIETMIAGHEREV